MAPASNEEQFKFLISCIRYSNNGKVDFGQVAQECKIVSKGAAAKRYERMMRSHGIAPNAATIKSSSSRIAKFECRESKNHTSKKRKASAFPEDNTTADDEETFSRVKPDPASVKEQCGVKAESSQLTLDDAANLMQYYGTPTYSSQVGEDEVYTSNDYDSSSAGYHSPVGGPYGLQDQQQYDFSFATTGINCTATALPNNIQYQPIMQYPTVDTQGGSESPLIVD